MSMREYPMGTYGLSLNEEAVFALAKAVSEKNKDGEYKDAEPDFYADAEYISYYNGGLWSVTCQSDIIGELIGINADGVCVDGGVSVDHCCILELDRFPGLFKQAYKDFEEIVAELKEKTLGAISEEYIRENVAVFEGVYWG